MKTSVSTELNTRQERKELRFNSQLLLLPLVSHSSDWLVVIRTRAAAGDSELDGLKAAAASSEASVRDAAAARDQLHEELQEVR